MKQEREKEEKLLRAIGDLPEDMVAEAADYQSPGKGASWRAKWLLAGKGAVLAACAAALVFGLAPWVYKTYGGSSGQVITQNQQPQEEKNSSMSGGLLEKEKNGERAEGEVKLWGEVTAAKEETAEKGKTSVKENWDDSAGARDKKAADTGEMKPGKTLRLRVDSTEGLNGEEIKALAFIVGEQGDGMKYTLHSKQANCKIISITSGGQVKMTDLQEADCKGGDRIGLTASLRTEGKWASDPAPEWEGKGIDVLDMIEITGEREGETYHFGRIVIGKKGEKYYGLYQKKYD